jgi:hypothetical protein
LLIYCYACKEFNILDYNAFDLVCSESLLCNVNFSLFKQKLWSYFGKRGKKNIENSIRLILFLFMHHVLLIQLRTKMYFKSRLNEYNMYVINIFTVTSSAHRKEVVYILLLISLCNDVHITGLRLFFY